MEEGAEGTTEVAATAQQGAVTPVSHSDGQAAAETVVGGSKDWQMGNTGVVLLAGALGELIRRPWKGAVLFERHLERQKGPCTAVVWGDVELRVPMCAAQLECGRRVSRLCRDFD